MIKAIIFDCFGVLTNDTWKEFLTSIDAKTRDDVRSVHAAYDKGFIEYTDFRRQVVESTKSDDATIDAIFMRHTKEPKNHKLLSYIQELGANYKIGILSNVGTPWIRESFLTAEEIALFDDMVLSFEVGMGKPDPAVYKLACDRLSVAPEEAIFIDDLPPYCQVARDVGMQAIAYENFEQFHTEIQQLLADSDN